MKNKFSILKNACIVAVIICALCINVLAGTLTLRNGSGEDSPFVWNIEEQYCRLKTVENLVSAQINGIQLDVQLYMAYPSGKTINGQSFTLDEAGRYTVKAMAVYEDAVYTDEKTFLVYTPMFEVEGGSVQYRNHPYTDITGQTSDISGVNGLLVSIPKGSKLTVTAPLDISECSYSNALLQFYVVSAQKGVMDFDYLRFTFTDFYDPDNSLTITCLNKSNGPTIRQNMNWWQAGASGQNLVGYQNDLGQDRVWINSVWGCGGIGSFCMSPWKTDDNLINDQFGIWMDENLKIYAGRSQNYVCDLDDPKFHTNLWEGFSSNLVTLTIEADGYTGDQPAQIFITHLLSADLQAESVFDTNAPSIILDCAPYTENKLPNACVGKPYPVFDAIVTDPDMNPTNVEIAVYGGMYSDTRYLVDARNSSFTPDLPGTYTIEYTASDSWGNTTRKCVYVYAKEQQEDLTLNLRDQVLSGKVGQKIHLPQADVSGNFGNAQVDIEVLFGEETVACENGAFTPFKEGVYQVCYTVTDYIGQQTQQTYEVKIEKTDVAIFGQLPVVNRYILADVQNYIPVATAYNYVTADGDEIETVTYVEDAKGIHQVEGRRFIPAAGTESCTIWWEATIEGKTATSEKLTVPVITVKEGEDYHFEKFFVCENTTAVATENCVIIQPATDGAKAEWANPLLAEGFNLTFAADKIERCTVLLTDYEHPEQKLEIVIDMSTGVAVVNGTRNYPLAKTGLNYVLTFNPASNKLSDGSTSLVPLDEEGNTFGGFSSGKLYLTMSFDGVQTGAAVKVSSINAQNLNNRTFDILKPGISVLGETGGYYEVGNTVTVFRAVTADVVSPFCTFYINVLDPDGNVVTDVNGVTLEKIYPDKDFTIKLTKIGAYVVQFYSEDVDGNKERNISYVLNVLDMTAPVMEAPSSAIPETAALGEKLSIPTVKAHDDVDGELQTFVYVQRPDLRVQTVTNSYLELTQTGMYVIKYYAFDANGNSTILEYTVFVS